VQIAGSDRALLRCHPGSGGAEHLHAWQARCEPMPVAIALGGPPILTWLAGLPLPEGVTETSFAGYLNDRPLRMARCRDTALAVPAAAEIVIEGWVQPGEVRPEGPFGNHTGRYVPASPAPVIRVTRISLREGAVCPCTLVGPPPMENLHLAEHAARILLPLLQYDHPWVTDLHLPPEGIFHRAAMVAVADGCRLSAAEIGRALWSSLLLKKARLVVLLDSDTVLSDPHNVYWRVINSCPWPPAHHNDDGRVILDARTLTGEQRVAVDDDTARVIARRWREYGL
jgi:4-hydroxy-3-polyprenylbenzoate decarboxylase